MAVLIVHVIPRARVSAVAGRHGDAIRVRVAAPPADGAANTELCRFLAERLGVPRAAVSITRGARGRRKTVSVAGVSAAVAERSLLEESR